MKELDFSGGPHKPLRMKDDAVSKHTLGPWEVAPRIGRYQVIPSSEDERRKLARINALEFDALSVGAPNGQMAMIPLDESNRANANLIAAAPDLLEALDRLTKWAEVMAEAQTCEHTIAVARKALIKALTGESK